MIEKTISIKAQKECPDFDLFRQYEIVLPVYRVRISATIIQNNELSIICRFLLRAISVGVKSTAEASDLLGLSHEDIIEAGGELLQAGLIDQDSSKERNMRITPNGEYAINEMRIASLKRKSLWVDYDPLVKETQPIDDTVLSSEQVQKHGLFTIPIIEDRPEINDFDLTQVKESIAPSSRQEIVDVVELNKIDECYVVYRPGINVVVLKNKQDGKIKFCAFRGISAIPNVSAALERMASSGINLLPEEIAPKETSNEIPLKLSDEEKQTITKISDLESTREHLNSQIEVIKDLSSSTAELSEKARLNEKLSRTQIQYESTLKELEASKKQLDEQTNRSVYIVPTEKNHALLIRAIDESEKETIIVSPWIDSKVVDEELLSHLKKAFTRGVKIKIAWGLGLKTRRGPESDRSRAKALPAIQSIKAASNGNLGLLEIREEETHEKILICDDKFCAVGSFNWLSYRGDIDSQYRRECSYYSERPFDIRLWKTNVSGIFDNK